MDHAPLPPRSQPALRWLVALLLLVAGGVGLAPAVEADEVARVQSAVVVDRHERVVRRRVGPEPLPARRRPLPRLIDAAAARLQALVAVLDARRRGPPRTPCVVALT